MQKKAIKRVALLVTAIMIAGVLAGCGSAALNRQPVPSTTASPGQPVRVTGSCDMTIENNKAKVSCKTDIMDGAIFKLSICSVEGKQLKSAIIAKNGDNLAAEFDLSDVADQKIYGFATCAPDLNGKQPDAVSAKYGAKFQNIQSESLIWSMDSNILVFSSGEKSR